MKQQCIDAIELYHSLQISIHLADVKQNLSLVGMKNKQDKWPSKMVSLLFLSIFSLFAILFRKVLIKPRQATYLKSVDKFLKHEVIVKLIIKIESTSDDNDLYEITDNDILSLKISFETSDNHRSR